MSQLILLRHAKSAYPPGVDDHDRPLNDRGRRDAPVAGEAIAEYLPAPQRVLVSTALRAQQTWRLAAAALAAESVTDDPELYLASAGAMLDRIRTVEETSLVVVAHNPGTEWLAAQLAANPQSPAFGRMQEKFPTAAFAVLTSDLPFAQWSYGQAHLDAFEVPRGVSR